MMKRWMCLIILTLSMVGCKDAKSLGDQAIIFNPEKTRATIFSTAEISLLTIEYLLTNQSDEWVEPFYLNFIVHDETLQHDLGMDVHSPFRRLGGTDLMISLGPGETYAGGFNLEISKVADQDGLKWQMVQNNAIEIQLLSLEDDRILDTYWIHHVQFERE